MAKFWMIAHRTNGTVLPAPMGRGGRGGTHVEPVPEDGITPPRLFHTEAAAKNALRWWLGGVVNVQRAGGYDSFAGEYYDDESWHIEPMPDRKAEEWHIVPVKIERQYNGRA